MNKFKKTFFYKRNFEKDIIMSRNIKGVKVGDVITFYGNLYDNKKYTKKVANTIIEYRILLIKPKGVLIETRNKYIFKNGTLYFMGNIFSPNFDIISDVVQPYIVKSSVQSFIKGTKKYRYGYGHSMYKITGRGIGEIKIDLDICK